MDVGVHGPAVFRAYSNTAVSHPKMHPASPAPLLKSQAHTSSSYSIQSQPSSRSSDTTQGTAQSTLFPPSVPALPMASEAPVRNDNVMNKVAEKEQSLFQICVILRQRLRGVPGFESFLEEEEQCADQDTDPVSILWRTLRRGYPLLTLYNVLCPEKAIQPDLSTMSSELKKGKAMTFKFLHALIHDLSFKVEECFIILDLYGDDTTGFVKVTKTVTRLLDVLVDRGIIEDTRRDSAEPCEGNVTVQRSQRHHIIDELVNTERTYVQQLELLQAFQNQCQKTGVIPGDVIHQIFLNLNGLLDFQRRFLIRVEQINAQPEPDQNWGKLFMLYNDSFVIYEPYITNQKQCEETVMKEFEKLRMAGGSAELQGIVVNPSTLYSFLMKPFQRLSKYPLLLDQLYKKGDLDEERKADLLLGKVCATAVLTRTNEAMEQEDKLAAVQELKVRVEDWKGHRVEGFGDLLLFGTFTVLKNDLGPTKDSEREYHVYFFESILLCCKDIDLTKAKNKMKNKPLLDKRGKPKLQLKGRIFMQNVTDVVRSPKDGPSHSCQIYWRGDPGIENFTIRFTTEDVLQKWYSKLLEQKQSWLDATRTGDTTRPPGTSSTEFTYLQNQGQLENPYRQDDEEEDDEAATVVSSTNPYGAYPSENSTWNGSQISLRARSATGESGPPPSSSGGRMPHPRFPPGSLPGAPLSLQTHMQPNASSPTSRIAESYFSPTTDSPVSSRTSTSSGMYFPRQPNHFDGGHERYTAPLPYRSASREAMGGPPGYPQSARAAPPRQPGIAQQVPSGSRNRSASSPNMNDIQRRQMNSSRPPMPAVPIPSHVQHPPAMARAQSNSPHLGNGIDERLGSSSPNLQRERSQTRTYQGSLACGLDGPQRPDHRFVPQSAVGSRTITPVPYGAPAVSPPLPSATPTMSPDSVLSPQPSQLKVKVHATSAGQTLTLVVSHEITYQSLKDRIDAKLQRSTNITLSGDKLVKLKYLDECDYVTIACDEDVKTAFETWCEQKREGLDGMVEIELFVQ